MNNRSEPSFFWSVAPLGLGLRIGVIALVATVAHKVHAVLLCGAGAV